MYTIDMKIMLLLNMRDKFSDFDFAELFKVTIGKFVQRYAICIGI